MASSGRISGHILPHVSKQADSIALPPHRHQADISPPSELQKWMAQCLPDLAFGAWKGGGIGPYGLLSAFERN